MNPDVSDTLGTYAADFQVAAVRSRAVIWLVALGWFVFPFIVQTLIHPSDAIRLLAFLHGQARPVVFTVQQLAAGFIETVFVLAAFCAFQLIGTVLFYRRAALNGASVARPALWPLAAVTVGVIGNTLWFVALGYFDFGGCVIGLLSTAFTIIAECICEQLGRDFVFGPATGFHPA